VSLLKNGWGYETGSHVPHSNIDGSIVGKANIAPFAWPRKITKPFT